jgi:transposase
MTRSRLNRAKQNRLIEHFVAGASAPTAAVLVGLNKTTAAHYFYILRELICEFVEHENPFSGEIEVHESCLGGKSKGKRGCGS